MENTNYLISCCGSDCSKCYCYGKMCQGCNIKGYKSCGECSELPCGLILGTRDPSMTEEEFMKTVDERVKRLKG